MGFAIGLGVGLPFVRRRSGGGAPAWAPADLSGLTATPVAARAQPGPGYVWADDARTTLAGHGDRIAAVELVDAAGARTGQFATQTDPSARPKLLRVGGEWRIVFDGAQWLDLPPALLSGLTAAEAFVTFTAAAKTATDDALTGLWTMTPEAVGASHMPYTDGNGYDGFGASARKSLGAFPTGRRNVYNPATAAGAWSARLNGAALFSTASNTVAWPAAPGLGRSYGAGGGTVAYLRGSVSEFAVFAAVLSGGDRAGVYGHFARLVPGDLGAAFVGASRVVLGATPAVGGSGARVCELFRDGVSLGYQPEDGEWADEAAAPSTRYVYRVDVTDDTGTASASASVTTPAAGTGLTFPDPGGAATELLNGSLPNDVDGDPAELREGGVTWDREYGVWRAVGIDLGGYGPGPVSTTDALGYYSRDLLNWKRMGTLVAVPGGLQAGESYIERPKLLQHPSGAWFLFAHVWPTDITDLPAHVTGVWRSPTGAAGTFVRVASLNFGGAGLLDVDAFQDRDGSAYLVANTGDGSRTAHVLHLAGDWLSVRASALVGAFLEGGGLFRRGGRYHQFASGLTGFAPNQGYCLSFLESPLLPVHVNRTGAAVWTTPDSNYTPDTAPYLGTTGGDAPWGSGTNYGVHPSLSYNSQPCHAFEVDGRVVLQSDRWVGQGGPESAVVWLDVSYDGDGLPLLPFAQTWAPTARPPAPGDLALLADARDLALSDAAAVSSWAARVGGTITQAAAGRRPTYRAAGLFGAPGVEFDGGDELALPALSYDRRDFTAMYALWLSAVNTGDPKALLGNADSTFNFYQASNWAVFDGAVKEITGTDYHPGFLKLVVRCTAAGTQIFVGGADTAYGQVGSGAANDAGTVSTQAYLGGINGFFPLPAGSKLARVAFYGRSVTDDEVADGLAWLEGVRRTPELMSASATPKLVAFDGNSIVAGSGLVNASDTLSEQVLAALGATWRGVNLAYPSQQTPEIVAQAPARVDPFFKSGRTKNVCVVWEGSNHLRIGGASAAAAYASLTAYIQARQAAGWKVVVPTVLPRENDAAFNTARLALNDLIRANAAGADAIADVAAIAQIGDFGDESDGTYYQDTIHLTAAGQALAAPVVADAVLAV